MAIARRRLRHTDGSGAEEGSPKGRAFSEPVESQTGVAGVPNPAADVQDKVELRDPHGLIGKRAMISSLPPIASM